MTWPFDSTSPVVSPQDNAEYMRRRAGISEAEWVLPSTLVATFQPQSWQQLASRCDLASVGPGPMLQPLRGRIEGAPIAAARMMIGAPAAAITIENAIARGVRNVLVVGSAGSLRQDLPIGSAVVVTGAEREDGTSHHYLPVGEMVEADPALSDRLDTHARARGLGPRRGRAWTIDAPFRETAAAVKRHRDAGVLVVEMEAAAMFAVARVRGVQAALIVSVSDELSRSPWQPGFDDQRYLDTLMTGADAVIDCAVELLKD